MLKQQYFPVLGSMPKKFVGRNRRALDMSVAQFELDADKSVDRANWGLPVPNIEAAYISLAKYAKDVPSMDTAQVNAMNMGWDWTSRHFGVHMLNSRVKSVEEVLPGIDMSTSPGVPWNRKYKTKKMMYDDWKEELPRYMNEDWERLKCNNYVAVFGNSLKEEIRPAEKLAANSLRTFTAGPIEMTIHGNRLFEDMNQKMYQSHLQTASVVGFSPWKGGWDELYRKLLKFPNGFALDESQYDSSLRQYMMWGCARLRWSMLRVEDQTEDNLSRLLVYYQNLVNTVIVTSDGVFVRKTGGNPSGSVNTISDNTLILYTLIAYGWIRTATTEMCSFEKFEANLALALCGDDNTWTVSDEALPFFNARSLIKEWATIGITTTTDSLDPRPPVELDFLSAHTVFINGKAVPLYDREKLLTSLLYSSAPNDPAYTLVRACALLRVGWADIPTRGYLKELIQWLMKKYNRMLLDDPDWVAARQQIPNEDDLLKLFVGIPESKQGFTREKTALCPPEQGACFIQNARKMIKLDKKFFVERDLEMNAQVARPQRQRGRKQRGKKAGPRPQIGPRLPNGGFSTGGRGRKRGRRSRRGGKRGGGNQQLTMRGPRLRIDGLRPMKRHPFGNDEYIDDIVDSTTSLIESYSVNPGQASLFPWLSKEAILYEKYVFTRLEFYYKREVSEFATDGTTGKVVYSFDYDASDGPPSGKQQQMDTDPHKDAMPCENFSLRVDCREAFNNGPKYVRPGGLPGSADIKTYDMGLLNIGAYGNAASGNKVGELHVRYAGYFEKPVLEATTTAPANFSVSQYASTTPQTLPNGGVGANLLLGTVQANGVNAVNNAGQITLPAGNYIAFWTIQFFDSTAVALCEAFLAKNGTQIGLQSLFDPTAGTDLIIDATLNGQTVLSSNGTDYIQLYANLTGSGATHAGNGSLTILAV